MSRRLLSLFGVFAALLCAGCAEGEARWADCRNNRLAPEAQAEACTHLLTDLSPEDRVEALHRRGFVYFAKLERLDLALADFNEAVVLDAEHPNPKQRASLYFNRGRLHYALDNFSASVEDFTTAAETDQRWPDPLDWSASIRSKHLRDHTGAIRDIEEAIRRYPNDPDLQQKRCEILERANDGALATCS